jgi:hypothetical protein
MRGYFIWVDDWNAIELFVAPEQSRSESHHAEQNETLKFTK